MDDMHTETAAQMQREYDEILLSELKFSRGEIYAIFDANNGTHLASGGWQWMNANIEDSEGLGEKWGIDAAALAKTLAALPRDCKFRLAQLNMEFWARCDEPSDTVLESLGLLKPQESNS